MLTIIESPIFTKLWRDYWTVEEHGEFASFISANPGAGDLIPGSGGCRNNIPAHILRKLAEELGHGD